jgi:hypothetical protein
MEDTNTNMAVHDKNVKPRTKAEESWTEVLVADVSDIELNQAWRDALHCGYPRSIVLRVWYIEDRERSALVAYC